MTVAWSEASIISALATSFEWHRRICCPNVQEGSEMDFLLLTESQYLWECEIKISVADWKNDLKKIRHYNPGWGPARFYYAVPSTLVPGDQIPEWVPDHAGVLALDNRRDYKGGVAHDRPHVRRWLRQARVLHRAKAGPEVAQEMRRKIYFRYWRHVAPALERLAPPAVVVEGLEP